MGNGNHTIQAKAVAVTGGSVWLRSSVNEQSSIQINVQNPVGYIDRPQPNATRGGTVRIDGWAKVTGSTISRVEIWIDGTKRANATYGTSRPDAGGNVGWQWDWDTTKETNGNHTIQAKAVAATDGSVWLRSSANEQSSIQINVQNPTGYIDRPQPNTTRGGTVRIDGWAKVAGSTISRVEIWIDGTKRANATYGTSRPDAGGNVGWQWDWDTTKESNGNHTIQVKAVAANGGSRFLPSSASNVSNVPIIIQNQAGCSVSINNGAIYHRLLSTQLKLNAPGAAMMQISNDGGFGGATWQPYQSSITWTLNDPGQRIATLVVYARFRDSAGVFLCGGGNLSDDTIYDPLPPSVTIRLAHAQVYVNTGILSQATYTVEIAASDQTDGSGIEDMQISLQDDFADATWQSVTETMEIGGQSGDTIYVRVRDQVGNISATVSIAISDSAASFSTYLPFVVR